MDQNGFIHEGILKSSVFYNNYGNYYTDTLSFEQNIQAFAKISVTPFDSNKINCISVYCCFRFLENLIFNLNPNAPKYVYF